MAENQRKLFYQAQKRIADINKVFLDMTQQCPASGSPLTNKELAILIEKRPSIWGRFSSYLGKLND